jgi:ATP-dependent Clp protease adaptor protein ClpS
MLRKKRTPGAPNFRIVPQNGGRQAPTQRGWYARRVRPTCAYIVEVGCGRVIVHHTMPNDPKRPPAPERPVRPSGPEEDVDVEERQKTATPKRFRVIFHNDDYTTMEYVIEVLRRFFHKSETEALHIMLTVHKKGKAVAGVYPRDLAETKVAEVMRDARDRGHPLLLTTEPE